MNTDIASPDTANEPSLWHRYVANARQFAEVDIGKARERVANEEQAFLNARAKGKIEPNGEEIDAAQASKKATITSFTYGGIALGAIAGFALLTAAPVAAGIASVAAAFGATSTLGLSLGVGATMAAALGTIGNYAGKIAGKVAAWSIKPVVGDREFRVQNSEIESIVTNAHGQAHRQFIGDLLQNLVQHNVPPSEQKALLEPFIQALRDNAPDQDIRPLASHMNILDRQIAAEANTQSTSVTPIENSNTFTSPRVSADSVQNLPDFNPTDALTTYVVTMANAQGMDATLGNLRSDGLEVGAPAPHINVR